ncbi:MAG: YfbM family protein [Pirellulales bacterium]
MGIYCEVRALSAAEFERLAEDPDALFEGEFDADEPEALGASAASDGEASPNRISLEKAWHGLHYLLTGTAAEGTGPLAFLLAGGQNLGDESEPIRYFPPGETSTIHRALSAVSDEELWSRFDPQAMEAADVYPNIWDEEEEELQEEFLMYFGQLKSLVAAAAASGNGLLVSIG